MTAQIWTATMHSHETLLQDHVKCECFCLQNVEIIRK